MNNNFNRVIDAPEFSLVHRVRLPETPVPGGSPCLILLHGVGANESGFVEFARELDSRYVVILARGPLVLGPSQFAWFQVQFTANGPVINAPQAESARQKIAQFISEVVANYGVAATKIVVAGFSQGGIMSASAALTVPERVAGFGLLSGRILPEISPLIAAPEKLRTLKGIVLHGRQDPVLPVMHAHRSREKLQELGVAATYAEYDAAHEFSAAMQQDFTTWMETVIPLS